MSSEKQIEFTKENIDTYLKEVAKEYRKQIGKNMPAEMILIGGASVLVNYGFRDMTTDIDAVIQAASVMKDVINRVGDRYDLPNGWLNQDFVRTESYSRKRSSRRTPNTTSRNGDDSGSEFYDALPLKSFLPEQWWKSSQVCAILTPTIAQIKIFFIPCNRSRKMLSIIVMALLKKEVIYG